MGPSGVISGGRREMLWKKLRVKRLNARAKRESVHLLEFFVFLTLFICIIIYLLPATCIQLALPWSSLLPLHRSASSGTCLFDEAVHQKTFFFLGGGAVCVHVCVPSSCQ